jgi:hypothetical protein
MALQQGLGAGENIENLLLGGVHSATLRQAGEKTKSFFGDDVPEVEIGPA